MVLVSKFLLRQNDKQGGCLPQTLSFSSPRRPKPLPRVALRPPTTTTAILAFVIVGALDMRVCIGAQRNPFFSELNSSNTSQ
jgi:hypothetical protein